MLSQGLSAASLSLLQWGHGGLHPALSPSGQGHVLTVTFQGSEECRAFLAGRTEPCFLPRQSQQSMGKFYFER